MSSAHRRGCGGGGGSRGDFAVCACVRARLCIMGAHCASRQLSRECVRRHRQNSYTLAAVLAHPRRSHACGFPGRARGDVFMRLSVGVPVINSTTCSTIGTPAGSGYRWWSGGVGGTAGTGASSIRVSSAAERRRIRTGVHSASKMPASAVIYGDITSDSN